MAEEQAPGSKSQQWWNERLEQDFTRVADVANDPSDVIELGYSGRTLRTRDHAALVYWTEDELLSFIVPYLLEGFRVRDKVAYVADELSPDAIRRAVAAAGIDVAEQERAGSFSVVASRDAYFQGGYFDVERALESVKTFADQVAREGFKRVRFSVEMTYLLYDVPGIEQGPEFESRSNDEVFARFPFVCVCSFNGARDVSSVLGNVLETHPIVLAGGIPMVNPYYKPWSVFEAQQRADRRAGDLRTAVRPATAPTR
jgi:hypothetical protein